MIVEEWGIEFLMSESEEPRSEARVWRSVDKLRCCCRDDEVAPRSNGDQPMLEVPQNRRSARNPKKNRRIRPNIRASFPWRFAIE